MKCSKCLSICAFSVFLIFSVNVYGQNWLTTGNAGMGTGNFLGTTDSKSLLFRTNNIERMRLTEAGNLGIGNATIPDFKFEVNLDSWAETKIVYAIDAHQPSIRLFKNTGATTEVYRWDLQLSDETNTWGAFEIRTRCPWGNSSSSTNLYSNVKNLTSGSMISALTILPPFSSNSIPYVGIGTRTPDNPLTVEGSVRIGQKINENSDLKGKYMLSVGGTIVAKELIITDLSTDWADYVFDDTYKLTPLLELDKEIKELKHLPEIPSTSEVKEQGVNIGALQVKLLQKLEEATLYLIELKKENVAMKREIEELKKEVGNEK